MEKIKRSGASSSDLFIGCIDPPGPWSPSHVHREFLESLRDLPDCPITRSLRRQHRKYLREQAAVEKRRSNYGTRQGRDFFKLYRPFGRCFDFQPGESILEHSGLARWYRSISASRSSGSH